MAKNLHDLRFGIRRDDGYISNTWRLWITKLGDVYLTIRGDGGVEKFSFHVSGICRHAFTKEHGVPSTMSDRLMYKWTRAKTPLKNSGQASRVAWIAFPTDFLSRISEKSGKQVTWVPAAPRGAALFVELGYTLESERSVLSAFKNNERHLLTYTPLPSGEAVFLSFYAGEWENKDLRSPAAPGSIFPSILFSADDPKNTGRPVRIRFGPIPKDGDALFLQELGGYAENLVLV